MFSDPTGARSRVLRKLALTGGVLLGGFVLAVGGGGTPFSLEATPTVTAPVEAPVAEPAPGGTLTPGLLERAPDPTALVEDARVSLTDAFSSLLDETGLRP